MQYASACNAFRITLETLGNLRQNLAYRLDYYREKLGWTQYDLAPAAKMSVPGLRGYEQRKRWPDPEDLERLAKAFNQGFKNQGISIRIDPIDLLREPSDVSNSDPSQLVFLLKDMLNDPVVLNQLETVVRAYFEHHR